MWETGEEHIQAEKEAMNVLHYVQETKWLEHRYWKKHLVKKDKPAKSDT